jgi:hypothetical protein
MLTYVEQLTVESISIGAAVAGGVSFADAAGVVTEIAALDLEAAPFPNLLRRKAALSRSLLARQRHVRRISICDESLRSSAHQPGLKQQHYLLRC